MNPETHKMWYITGVLDYISTEYDTDWDRKYFQVTPEMAHYLEECYSTLMCYPNAAGGFVELFKINVK